jgi:hypothetical protein
LARNGVFAPTLKEFLESALQPEAEKRLDEDQRKFLVPM